MIRQARYIVWLVYHAVHCYVRYTVNVSSNYGLYRALLIVVPNPDPIPKPGSWSGGERGATEAVKKRGRGGEGDWQFPLLLRRCAG